MVIDELSLFLFKQAEPKCRKEMSLDITKTVKPKQELSVSKENLNETLALCNNIFE
jgi:hypothetical protein